MSIKIYFGVPGSGKTTLAARIALMNLRRGIPTFSNVPIKGTIKINSSDIGFVNMSDGELLVDEAGIDFNSRAYKSMPKEQIQWFKLSRHYGIQNIHIFSQSYEDMDVTLRRLADEIYVVKKTIIPALFMLRRISVKVGVDKESHQIMDMYYFMPFGFKFYFGWHYWHMFDSWSAPVLPRRNWQFSSYPSYQIDKKYACIMYRDLSKQGRLPYKVFTFVSSLFLRKKLTQGEESEN